MADRLRKVQELFEQAADLDPDQRREFLYRAAGGDDTLVTEVEELLRHDSESNDSLFISVRDQAASTFGDRPRRETIGKYRVVRELGQGGMGTVYLAKRDDKEYDKDVAIKLVPAVVDRDELMRRFRAERQIMASLVHPNIAQLLDGDTTRDGVPYVVMEYVPGQPIDEYCADNALSPEERLALFLKVCNAVTHAHRNLVVHRDIKPGNILVTADGEPKLLDFGIAKILDTEAGPALTRSGMRLMTPEYASPEQARGEPVNTATDVYSLGVLLHRLLTGALPYDIDTRDVGAVERAICELPPAPPSSFDPAIGRELDAIVLMALRKEPERRYPTVDAFAEDIDRYLRNQPVAARPDTVGYRLGLFVKRNSIAVTAAAAMLIMIVGFGAAMTWQAIEISKQRDRAERSLQRADDSLTFLVSMFEDAAPKMSRGSTFTAKDLLDRGRERIGEELAEHPESQGYLMGILGAVYYELDELEAAEELHLAALERHEALGDEDPAELRNTLLELSRVYLKMNRTEDALAYTLRGIDVQNSYMAPDDPARILPLQRICSVYYYEQNYEAALPWCRQTVEIARLPTTTRPESLSAATNGLANVYLELGDLEAALPLYIESQQVDINELGSDHPWSAISTGNVALVYRKMKRLEEAENSYRQALAIAEKVWPPTHSERERLRNSLALVLRLAGRIDEAEGVLLPVLDEFESGGVAGDWAYASLAELYELSGQFEKMRNVSERYLEFASAAGDPARVIDARDFAARSLIGLGRLDEAWSELDRAIARHSGNEVVQGKLASLRALRAYLQTRRGLPVEDVDPVFDEALAQEDSEKMQIRLLRARALALQGKTDAALAEMQTVTDLGLEDPWETVPDLGDLSAD